MNGLMDVMIAGPEICCSTFVCLCFKTSKIEGGSLLQLCPSTTFHPFRFSG